MKDNEMISPYSKLKVYWNDRPENYSRENKNKVRNYFVKKYGVNKNSVEVIYQPVRFDDKGDVIELTGASIENIMDVTYQRDLMKEWIKRESRNVDFDRIIKLDDKVNAELNLDTDQTQHKSWAIKWIMINNFLSFGEENYIPFNRLKGLTVVNSVPANQGGKCLRANTNVKIQFNKQDIINKLGFLPDELDYKKNKEEIINKCINFLKKWK